MSEREIDALSSFKEATEYYEEGGSKIIDNPSGMEMFFFLERIVDANQFTLSIQSTPEGSYITIEDNIGTYIVIDACSRAWGLHDHQDQFILRARVCEVKSLNYEFIHNENTASFDQKLIYVTEGKRHFIEARRFINMAGGTTVENFTVTLCKFIDSSRLLAYALQHSSQTKKTATARDFCYDHKRLH